MKTNHTLLAEPHTIADYLHNINTIYNDRHNITRWKATINHYDVYTIWQCYTTSPDVMTQIVFQAIDEQDVIDHLKTALHALLTLTATQNKQNA